MPLSRPASRPGRAIECRLPLVFAAVVALFAAAAPARAGDTPACWTPQQLAARPGEQLARHGLPEARRAAPSPAADADIPPAERSAPAAPGTVVRRVELARGDRRIALTFDLCEQAREIAGYDGRIVDVLRAANVRATFFAGGKWLLTHAERARQLIADPLFEVGNHGFEHRDVKLLHGKALAREIEAPQHAYAEVRRSLGERRCRDRSGSMAAIEAAPARMSLIRFPYGACDGAALQAANRAGLTAIQWDFASGDPDQGSGAKALLGRVLRHVRPGSIIVFHANGRGWHTAAALPAIIRTLRARGYDFATVGELIATPGARLVTEPVCFDQRRGDLDRYDRRPAGGPERTAVSRRQGEKKPPARP